jgi:hypothetical protein
MIVSNVTGSATVNNVYKLGDKLFTIEWYFLQKQLLRSLS